MRGFNYLVFTGKLRIDDFIYNYEKANNINFKQVLQ